MRNTADASNTAAPLRPAAPSTLRCFIDGRPTCCAVYLTRENGERRRQNRRLVSPCPALSDTTRKNRRALCRGIVLLISAGTSRTFDRACGRTRQEIGRGSDHRNDPPQTDRACWITVFHEIRNGNQGVDFLGEGRRPRPGVVWGSRVPVALVHRWATRTEDSLVWVSLKNRKPHCRATSRITDPVGGGSSPAWRCRAETPPALPSLNTA